MGSNPNPVRSVPELTVAQVLQTVIYIVLRKNIVGRDCVVLEQEVRAERSGDRITVRDFLHLSRPAVGPTSLLYNSCPASFLGVKRPGRGVECPPSSSTGVIPLLPIWAFMVCSRVNFTFSLVL